MSELPIHYIYEMVSYGEEDTEPDVFGKPELSTSRFCVVCHTNLDERDRHSNPGDIGLNQRCVQVEVIRSFLRTKMTKEQADNVILALLSLKKQPYVR